MDKQEHYTSKQDTRRSRLQRYAESGDWNHGDLHIAHNEMVRPAGVKAKTREVIADAY